MIKVQIRWLILGFIFLILFNVLFFLLGGNRPIASIWISYGFIHFAYLQILVIPSIVPKSKSTHVFIESTAVISTFYFRHTKPGSREAVSPSPHRAQCRYGKSDWR